MPFEFLIDIYKPSNKLQGKAIAKWFLQCVKAMKRWRSQSTRLTRCAVAKSLAFSRYLDTRTLQNPSEHCPKAIQSKVPQQQTSTNLVNFLTEIREFVFLFLLVDLVSSDQHELTNVRTGYECLSCRRAKVGSASPTMHQCCTSHLEIIGNYRWLSLPNSTNRNKH